MILNVLTDLLETRRVRAELRHVAQRDGAKVSEVLINRLAASVRCADQRLGRMLYVYYIESGFAHGYEPGEQPHEFIRASVRFKNDDAAKVFVARNYVRDNEGTAACQSTSR